MFKNTINRNQLYRIRILKMGRYLPILTRDAVTMRVIYWKWYLYRNANGVPGISMLPQINPEMCLGKYAGMMWYLVPISEQKENLRYPCTFPLRVSYCDARIIEIGHKNIKN